MEFYEWHPWKIISDTSSKIVQHAILLAVILVAKYVENVAGVIKTNLWCMALLSWLKLDVSTDHVLKKAFKVNIWHSIHVGARVR